MRQPKMAHYTMPALGLWHNSRKLLFYGDVRYEKNHYGGFCRCPCAVLALFLCACGGSAPILSGGNPTPTETLQPAGDENASKTEAFDPDRLVSSAFNQSGSYTDSLGNTYSYFYNIPMLSSSTGDALQLNQYLMDTLDPVVQQELDAMQEGVSLTVTSVDYHAYVTGSIVSVIASVRYPNDYIDYCVVNFDAAAGAEADTQCLLEYAGLSEEDFISAATAALDSYYQSAYASMLDDDFCQEQYHRSLEKMIENGYKPTVFLSQSGKLCVIADVFTPVGDYKCILSIID